MKTGLPRHTTVSRWPTWTGARSTSVLACASVSFAGFMLAMNGHSAEAAPIPPSIAPVRVRKSRRDASAPPLAPAAPLPVGCATSAIVEYLFLGGQPAGKTAAQATGLNKHDYATSCRIAPPGSPATMAIAAGRNQARVIMPPDAVANPELPGRQPRPSPPQPNHPRPSASPS